MTPEECSDKLEQLILDENEIVTYKLLSKELKIHVNEAKKCLYDFFKVHKSKEDVKMFAYYFLSGIIVKDGMESRKIVIVSENNLEKVKSDFKEVKSCHLYSLHKGNCQDEAALYNSQSWCKKWADEHKDFSSIKHPSLIMKEPSVRKLVVKKVDANIAPAKSSIVKQFKKEGTSSLFQNNSNKNSVNSKVEPDDKKPSMDEAQISKASDSNAQVNGTNQNSKPSTSKTTLGSLWQKLEDKSKKGKKSDSGVEGVKPNNNAKAAKKTVGKNNIMSLFSRQAEKKASNPVQQTTNNSVLSPEKSTRVTEVCDNVSPILNKGTVNKNSSQQNGKRKTSQRKSKRSTKKVNDSESDEEVKPKAKKHRRICTMDDSDSESESEEAKDKAQRSILTPEEPIASSLHMSDDNEEPIPPTPPVLLAKGKKKLWKTVQKTFEDEDGFLVAKQEKVLVSASDSDEDPVGSKNSVSDIKPKQDTFTYRKQTSLTSFFK